MDRTLVHSTPALVALTCAIAASVAAASAQSVCERGYGQGQQLPPGELAACAADIVAEPDEILSMMQVDITGSTADQSSWLYGRMFAGPASSLGLPQVPTSASMDPKEEQPHDVGRMAYQVKIDRATKIANQGNRERATKADKPSTFGSLVPQSAHMQKPWIGVIIMFAGQTLVNVGDIFQKGSHDEVARDLAEGLCKPGAEKPYFLRGRWLIGFGMWAVGALITWFSYWFAAESSLACIQIWGAAVVIGLAPKLLGEHVSIGVLAGVFMVVLGIAACSGSAPKAEEVQTADTLYLSWTNPAFFYVTFGFAGTIGVIFSRWLFLPAEETHWFEFILAAVIFDVYSILCSKATAMLSMESVTNHVNLVCTMSFWVHAFFTYFFRFSSMHFMNMAFKVRPAVVVVPVLLSLNTVGEAIAGGLFFGEFQNMTRVQEAWFFVGIACTIAGVGIMFTVRPDSSSCCTSGKTEERDLSPERHVTTAA